MSKRIPWLVALWCGVAACSSQTPFGTDAGSGPPPEAGAPQQQAVTNELALHQDMQAAWIADVAWTRFYIVDVVGGLPETQATLARVHASQDHIADVFQPVLGDHPRATIASMLHAHVDMTVRVIATAVTNDPNLIVEEASWYTNADALAHYIAARVPSVDEASLKKMLRNNLDQMLAETNARVAGDWQADEAACDAAIANITTVSSTLTGALASDFSGAVASSPVGQDEETLDLTTRRLWDQRALWMRNAIVSHTSHLADFDPARARLLRNQLDIADATFRPFYGDAMATELATLLQNDVNAAMATLPPVEARDMSGVSAAKAAWYAAGDAIAQQLASANPNWPLSDMEGHFRELVDTTMNEMSARVGNAWQADIDAHDELVSHSLGLSDVIAHGIAVQFQVTPK